MQAFDWSALTRSNNVDSCQNTRSPWSCPGMEYSILYCNPRTDPIRANRFRAARSITLFLPSISLSVLLSLRQKRTVKNTSFLIFFFYTTQSCAVKYPRACCETPL
ncbi:hypothetical protein VTO42DRAFT_1447 [Malbranchea cinnamomea]